MAKQICEWCGKEFDAKPSAHRRYCSRECASLAVKGRTQKPRVEKVKVKCAVCGKEEEVNPSRAAKYVCCSLECLGKYNSEIHSQKVDCTCPVCGKVFKVKPSRLKRSKNICCSMECSTKLRETLMLGEGNHQYGLKGDLNASFKGDKISRKNIHQLDVLVYQPNRPDTDKHGRITEHRLRVLENYSLFDPIFFTTLNDYVIFNPELELNIHHINCDHSNNNITNLVPLTKSQHKAVHNNLGNTAVQCINNIIGVLKLGELLETPAEDNQQLSDSSNTIESSETNSRIQTDNAEDSNTDTSALLNKIKGLINDYIVQTRNITEEGYKKSIEQILESGIKRPELTTN